MSHSPDKYLAADFCEICGFDEFYQRHRIWPGSLGGKYAPGNVIALCGNCHIVYGDNGGISREDLWIIVQARLIRDRYSKKITEEIYRNALQRIDDNQFLAEEYEKAQAEELTDAV